MRQRITMKKIYLIAIIFSALITSNFYKANAEKLEQDREQARIEKMQSDLKLAISKANSTAKVKYSYTDENFYFVWGLLDNQDDKTVIDLMAVSYCESQFKPKAFNPKNKNGTHDGGLWQINSVHGLDTVFDPVDNRDKALELYDSNGLKDWRSSQHCWKNVLSEYEKITTA